MPRFYCEMFAAEVLKKMITELAGAGLPIFPQFSQEVQGTLGWRVEGFVGELAQESLPVYGQLQRAHYSNAFAHASEFLGVRLRDIDGGEDLEEFCQVLFERACATREGWRGVDYEPEQR